jgi:oligopeptide/dipeptide ABC transporter ATP-binding protein
MSAPILECKDVHVYYHTERGPVKAVDGVNLQLFPGTRLGLVGESGCGKTSMALAMLRLLPPLGKIEGGEILLDGVDVVKLSPDEMRRVRLCVISLIPQGSMNSLNPVMRIKGQIMDGIQDHDRTMSEAAMRERVAEVLRSVDLDPKVADLYPHELSGGMKQRVCIAIAISLRPKVVIADEPTSALDVVVQQQVMETIERLQQEMGISIILIGHDMGLMAQSVQRLAVMYAGRLVEMSDVEDVFADPLHPYTQLLISTLPTLGMKGVFRGIPGITPSLLNPPEACLFHARCPKATGRCSEQSAPLVEVRPGRFVACHLYGEVKR